MYGAKKVIICARNMTELERVKNDSGDPKRVDIVQIDLSKPREVLQNLETYFKDNQQLNIVINNGGTSMRDEFKDLDFSVIENMIDVNLTSQIAVTKAALPLLIESGAKANNKGNAIINISSCSGFVGMPVRTLYSATKFGLVGFGKALRAEVKHQGISVLNIYPGYVQTNISKNAKLGNGENFGKVDGNIKKGLKVENAVDQIIRALTLGRREYIVGGPVENLLPYINMAPSLIDKLADIKYK